MELKLNIFFILSHFSAVQYFAVFTHKWLMHSFNFKEIKHKNNNN